MAGQVSYDPEWNPADYYLDFPDVPRYEGALVDMPLLHKIYKVREHLTNVLREAGICAQIGAELPALLTGLAAVDYLAGFRRGRRTKRVDYLSFLETYFPSAYQPHRGWIYDDLRCGLMHNLVAINPWHAEARSYRICSENDSHLSARDDVLIFAVPAFLEDVRRAWLRYVHQVVMKPDSDPDLESNFHRRFNRLEGVGAIMLKE